MCRRIDLQMRLCQRIKAGRTPDPAPAPRQPGPRALTAQAWTDTRRPGPVRGLRRRQAGRAGRSGRSGAPDPGRVGRAAAGRAPGLGAASLGLCPAHLLGKVFRDAS